MGGYLGVIAKFGPFCRRDNCLLVRGFFERLMTHLSIHVWGLPLVGIAGVVWVAILLVEGVGPMGVAGTLVELEVVEGLGEIQDGTFGWLLKSL